MFLIGKINPAKLLNFPEIDVFVLVACPENSLLDSKVLFKPVVTPYELELALVEERIWDGKYSADFRDLLVGGGNDGGSDEGGGGGDRGGDRGGGGGGDGVVTPVSLEWSVDEERRGGADVDGSDVYISLLDGKVHNKRGRAREEEDEIETLASGSNATAAAAATTTVALPNLQTMSPRERHELSVLPAKNAADYMMRMREYRGLEQR
jgi:hypothetical protein